MTHVIYFMTCVMTGLSLKDLFGTQFSHSFTRQGTRRVGE
jgi:hypothetical protein